MRAHRTRAARVGLATAAVALVVGGCAGPSGRRGPAAELAARCSSTSASSEPDRRTIEVGGTERTYLLEGPAADGGASSPAPLIVSLHGHGGSAATFEETTGLARAAASRGIATVVPDALGSPARWNFDRRPDGPDDGAFLDALIDEVTADGCVDPDRVALVGSSNGAAFAGLVACSIDHRVRAVVMVIATVPTGCDVERQPSVLTIRGTADTHVPFDGAAQLVADEAARAGCEPTHRVEHPTVDVERSRYTGCLGGTEVILDAVSAGTHRWPAGEPSQRSGGYDATEQILSFLALEL